MSNARILTDRESNTLENALLVAIDKFRANAVEFRALAPKLRDVEAQGQANGFIDSSACEPLAVQFDTQVEDTLELLNVIRGDDDDSDDPQITVQYR